MFFTIKNTFYRAPEQAYKIALFDAYCIIKSYPLKASELAIDKLIQQQYKMTLKEMCIKLLLNLGYYKDDVGNIILLFKTPKYDQIARLITYGNGAIPGSKILKIALRN